MAWPPLWLGLNPTDTKTLPLQYYSKPPPYSMAASRRPDPNSKAHPQPNGQAGLTPTVSPPPTWKAGRLGGRPPHGGLNDMGPHLQMPPLTCHRPQRRLESQPHMPPLTCHSPRAAPEIATLKGKDPPLRTAPYSQVSAELLSRRGEWGGSEACRGDGSGRHLLLPPRLSIQRMPATLASHTCSTCQPHLNASHTCSTYHARAHTINTHTHTYTHRRTFYACEHTTHHASTHTHHMPC